MLAAGQGLGALVAALVQPRKQLIDAFEIPLVPFRAALGDQKIFFNTECRENAATLRHEFHAAAHGLKRRLVCNVFAFEDDLAAARRVEADNRIHQRGLADPIAAEQAENLALLELQRKALQHIGIAVVGVDVLDVENGHGVNRSPDRFPAHDGFA